MYVAVRVNHPFAGPGWMVRDVTAPLAMGRGRLERNPPSKASLCVGGTFTQLREVAVARAEELNRREVVS